MLYGLPAEVDALDIATLDVPRGCTELNLFIDRYRFDIRISHWRPLVDATLLNLDLWDLSEALDDRDKPEIVFDVEAIGNRLRDPRNWMRAIPPHAQISIEAWKFRDGVTGVAR
jgi:hypothetical protein